ncbi:MAG TPA: 2-C-methyl-D-erythritol 2,4-cyclodiphosphate synthase [Bacteroidales bacterium]|nr:2-C-methyl-D-erythritol 2,4-cyclodiphosphate synthase [Bacteroidales bacterium]HPO64473.1 2-C-methyl-D-erythritol 2,4-cyclodiphosphate synthase [Bacteroidales bacterium]
MMRVGFGFDVHPLVEGHRLCLGGIEIPHTKGTLGHSDGDALIHAICDALLGAAALGDIGMHFPDNAAEFKDIDSKILLKRTVALLLQHNFGIGNIDVTVCLQRPKIAPFIPHMRATLAQVMQISENQISIKATTTEKLGYIGREEGVSVYAVALIRPLTNA